MKIVMIFVCVAYVGLLFNDCVFAWKITQMENRIKSLERIVGTETPASMTWTNGHTYSTIVKHSANCPCAKK